NGSGSIPVSGSANFIQRNFNSSALAMSVSNPAANENYGYIQTAPGTFVTVKVPGLEKLDNRIIHRAELLVYQVPDDAHLDVLLTPPAFVLLSSYDSVNRVKTSIPNDFTVNSSLQNNFGTFGGYVMSKET